MQKEITYKQAFEQLELLTRQMENEQIGLEELASRLKEAQQLIAYCHEKLYAADLEIRKILETEEKN